MFIIYVNVIMFLNLPIYGLFLWRWFIFADRLYSDREKGGTGLEKVRLRGRGWGGHREDRVLRLHGLRPQVATSQTLCSHDRWWRRRPGKFTHWRSRILQFVLVKQPRFGYTIVDDDEDMVSWPVGVLECFESS